MLIYDLFFFIFHHIQAMYRLFIFIICIKVCSCYLKINKNVYRKRLSKINAIKNQNQNINHNTNKMNLVYNDNVIEKIGIFSLSVALALLSDSPLTSLKKVGFQQDDFDKE